MSRARLLVGMVFSLALLGALADPARAVTLFQRSNLVSDIPGMAANTDPHLVNPWGLARTPTSPWWVADNGTGLSTLYNAAGTPQALVVTVPPSGGPPPSGPTGVAFANNTNAFNGDVFLFATEGGTINGWRGALGTFAETLADFSSSSAIYKGLAVVPVNNSLRAFATDFRNGLIQPFDGSAGLPALAGNFQDPGLPSGFAPFNIQVLNGKLYVTYAKVGPGGDDQAGPGNGFVDVYDFNGTFIQRLISNGPLNSPWGLAIAPPSFGEVAGDLLVGNFGDGKINAFDPTTGNFVETLLGTDGLPLINEGLWALVPGNSGSNGNANTLYFTAGIPGPDQVEDHGLFGAIAPSASTPEPATAGLVFLSGCALATTALRRRRSI